MTSCDAFARNRTTQYPHARNTGPIRPNQGLNCLVEIGARWRHVAARSFVGQQKRVHRPAVAKEQHIATRLNKEIMLRVTELRPLRNA